WWQEAGRCLGESAELVAKIVAICERNAVLALAQEAYDSGLHWSKMGLKADPGNTVLRSLADDAQLAGAEVMWRQGARTEAMRQWEEVLTRTPSLEAAWNPARGYELAQRAA